MHTLLVLVLFTLGSAAPCALIVGVYGGRGLTRGARALGLSVAAVTAFYNAYYLYPPNFHAEVSLPLQVCDLLGFVSISALLTDLRIARALVVICTVPFVAQAVLTPTGEQSIYALRTIIYWGYHGSLVSSFLFEAFVRRFRPSWSDFLSVCVVDAAYVLTIGSIDATLHWNYGYIGDAAPGEPTLVDVLGPWPFRIFNMTALAVSMQLIFYAAFRSKGASHGVRG